MRKHIQAVRDGAQKFFNWWIQELRDTRSEVVDRYVLTRRPRFSLQLNGAQAVLTRVGDPTGEHRPFDTTGPSWPTLGEIWPATKPDNATLDLVLADADVLVFEIVLPPLADHQVTGAIELQLERKLPLPREQLHVDWEVIHKAPDRSRTVTVAATRRTTLDRWIERVKPWGWKVTRVQCRDASGTQRFNMLPRRIQRVSFAVGRRDVLLAASAACLSVCYLSILAGQWIYERVSMQTQIVDARAKLDEVETLRATLAKETKPLLSVRALAQAPGAGSVLQALSTTLPPDAWLYQTDIQAVATEVPSITLEGYASSATALVQTLEQADEFEGVQLIEANATDTAGGQSRIKVKARLARSRP